MSIPSAADMPVTALFAGGRKGQVWDEQSQCLGYMRGSGGGVNPVVAVLPPFCICQIRLISNLHHSLNDRDR